MIIFCKKTTYLILAISLLISCAPIGRIPAKNNSVTADYPKNKKGLVIVRMLSPSTTWWQYFSLDENRKYKKSGIVNIVNIGGPNNYEVLMLDPGIYTLTYFQDIYSGNLGLIVLKDPLLSADGIPQMKAFEVKSEVVNYLGDLEFKNLNLNIKDNFESAKSFFIANYPRINSPIIKNLAYNKSGKAHE